MVFEDCEEELVVPEDVHHECAQVDKEGVADVNFEHK